MQIIKNNQNTNTYIKKFKIHTFNNYVNNYNVTPDGKISNYIM